MARMYKSRKGQSGSSKPHVTAAPDWSNTNVDEVTKLVVDLGKSGNTTAQIGTMTAKNENAAARMNPSKCGNRNNDFKEGHERSNECKWA